MKAILIVALALLVFSCSIKHDVILTDGETTPVDKPVEE